MASATDANKILCTTCNKAKGIYTCGGCSLVFCPKHSNDHRNELNKQLEGVVVEHDIVQQTLNQQEQNPQQHPLIQKINQWEKECINKIHETAEKARNQLRKSTTQHTTQVRQQLQILSSELKQGREDNDFSEIDLKQWTQKLEELRKELLNPVTISIQEDSISLINNIRIDHQDTFDIFERVCGNAQIEDNGRLVVGSGDHTEIRGKREYKTGRHIVCFRIERLSPNGWLFLGVITKSQPMQQYSYSSSSTYGWGTPNQIWIKGQRTYGQTFDLVQNDTIVLVIDCAQRKIELQNGRSDQRMDMSVDINQCPFPWQLHLNLHAPDTRVRIIN